MMADKNYWNEAYEFHVARAVIERANAETAIDKRTKRIHLELVKFHEKATQRKLAELSQ